MGTLAEGFPDSDTIYRNVAVGHWSSVEQLAARIRNEMDVVAANPNEAVEWVRLRNTAADVLEMYAEALRTRNAVFF